MRRNGVFAQVLPKALRRFDVYWNLGVEGSPRFGRLFRNGRAYVVEQTTLRIVAEGRNYSEAVGRARFAGFALERAPAEREGHAVRW